MSFTHTKAFELQRSSLIEEKFEGWAWVSGDLNPADWDWGTKPRSVEKVANDPFWKEGPEEEDSWPIYPIFLQNLTFGGRDFCISHPKIVYS